MTCLIRLDGGPCHGTEYEVEPAEHSSTGNPMPPRTIEAQDGDGNRHTYLRTWFRCSPDTEHWKYVPSALRYSVNLTQPVRKRRP